MYDADNSKLKGKQMKPGTYTVFGKLANGNLWSCYIRTGKRVEPEVIEQSAKGKALELEGQEFFPDLIQWEWK